jgi:hypothetical protein
MPRYNYVQSVLEELGAEMGLGSIKLDDTNRLSLVFDGVLVTFAYTTEPVELVWIYVDLGEIPQGGVAVPQRALQIGFECWAHNVMTIGLDDEGARAVGYSSIPVTVLALPLLKEMLDRILQATALVREQLAQTAFDEAQNPDSTGHSHEAEASLAAALDAGWERA